MQRVWKSRGSESSAPGSTCPQWTIASTPLATIVGGWVVAQITLDEIAVRRDRHAIRQEDVIITTERCGQFLWERLGDRGNEDSQVPTSVTTVLLLLRPPDPFLSCLTSFAPGVSWHLSDLCQALLGLFVDLLRKGSSFCSGNVRVKMVQICRSDDVRLAGRMCEREPKYELVAVHPIEQVVKSRFLPFVPSPSTMALGNSASNDNTSTCVGQILYEAFVAATEG